MQKPTRLASSDYFETLLEALYTGLESRNVALYRLDDSDGWTQSRTPESWRRHLECWFDLGGVVTFTHPSYIHDCRLLFAARYHADNDSRHQAALHAAMRDAIEYLLTTPLPSSARVMNITECTLEGAYSGNWVTVTIGFQLYLPR